MIRQAIQVACQPEKAFDVFTTQIDRWWPAERRHLSGKTTVKIEPSGRFWEENESGQVVELGKVTTWEPPQKLVLDFYPGTGPDAPTEATITFTPTADGTRIEVLHQPTERSKHLFDQMAPAYDSSWTLLLKALETLVKP